MAELLAAFYRIEVENRRCNLVWDERTEKAIIDIADYITNPSHRFGVMLAGSCGSGKTTLMRAFGRLVNHLRNEHHFTFMYQYFKPALFLYDANEIIDAYKDDEKFTAIRGKWMLGIDDLGEEPAEVLDYGNARYPVIRLLEHRYRSQLFTFVTTNLDGTMMAEKYGERIADRVQEMFHIIPYEGDSYRC